MDDFTKVVLFAEVKRKKENISILVLQEKAKKLLRSQLKDYTAEYMGFSMEDM